MKTTLVAADVAAGKEPAAALFGSVPFGGDPLSYVRWLHHGGGLELWQEIYEPYNVVPMACGVILSEAGGWYTSEINSPEDLQGLNIRICGLGGAIVGKLGADATDIPVGEISTSLETGRLDATELSFPLVDVLLGFDKQGQLVLRKKIKRIILMATFERQKTNGNTLSKDRIRVSQSANRFVDTEILFFKSVV